MHLKGLQMYSWVHVPLPHVLTVSKWCSTVVESQPEMPVGVEAGKKCWVKVTVINQSWLLYTSHHDTLCKSPHEISKTYSFEFLILCLIAAFFDEISIGSNTVGTMEFEENAVIAKICAFFEQAQTPASIAL